MPAKAVFTVARKLVIIPDGVMPCIVGLPAHRRHVMYFTSQTNEGGRDGAADR